MLRRFPKWNLEPGPLAWRTNLGLRGLVRLPIDFVESAIRHPLPA
jgi:hypothetical protein